METETKTGTAQRPPRTLIASDRVVGAEVRRPDGSKVGRIERLMLDKTSGRVAYVVMSFGGFLGLGEDYYTLPWAVLTYDTGMDAYSVDITEEQLRNAPARSPEGGDPQDEREWEEHVHRYYNAAPYWGI
ncbi:PRC-barrel domain-containing protein [Methylobacterium gnaphalii]|uniref:Photosystem reaction center subunit H n=1 Tax=Methylobacterium gnaphalii TaxID=1010610 RepID=A0A512JGK7_9HYPH|nr:PRC-barrel domain-containing protein [Methylobacterium gnaphalii]GEP09087.1 photosystem reaction center subunit H [Methylobacterium gnaphalii]GJD68400.1 hypothetical protein MMMDOFMJ_1323 [Methylobacterium gnaphalii]GLS49011.1 photosystem reaction center subunit H [Methylobacterium gnaphalii]